MKTPVHIRAAELMAALFEKAGPTGIHDAIGGFYSALIVAAEDPELARELRHMIERAKGRSQGITAEQVETRIRAAFHDANT